jgi:cell division protein FtsA
LYKEIKNNRAMTDYIVAIDLGTSHLVGVVGEKQSDGKFSIVAYDTEDSASNISRGNILNYKVAAQQIGNLINNLERELDGKKIRKVYVGVGGQSLRTEEYSVSMEIDEKKGVTEDDVNSLKEQCESYTPNLLDVLDIVPSGYYLDGHKKLKPEGMSCKLLEEKCRLIIGRASIRRDISRGFTEILDREFSLIVSPLSLAEAFLSSSDRELGCAFVNFGAGVTSVAVYKENELLSLSVIPLGGNLITKDLMTLKITEAEAEKLKKEHGSAIIRDEDKGEKIKLDRDGLTKEIEITDVNTIIEARIVEITENVMARIRDVTEPYLLGTGIVIAGGASQLANLSNMMLDRYKINVRPLPVRNELVTCDNEEIIRSPLYRTAISIMLKETEQCVEAPELEPFIETPSIETPFIETPFIETPFIETPFIETVLNPAQTSALEANSNPISGETEEEKVKEIKKEKPKKLSHMDKIREQYRRMKSIWDEPEDKEEEEQKQEKNNS